MSDPTGGVKDITPAVFPCLGFLVTAGFAVAFILRDAGLLPSREQLIDFAFRNIERAAYSGNKRKEL